jgi:hypothetical protein
VARSFSLLHAAAVMNNWGRQIKLFYHKTNTLFRWLNIWHLPGYWGLCEPFQRLQPNHQPMMASNSTLPQRMSWFSERSYRNKNLHIIYLQRRAGKHHVRYGIRVESGGRNSIGIHQKVLRPISLHNNGTSRVVVVFTVFNINTLIVLISTHKTEQTDTDGNNFHG